VPKTITQFRIFIASPSGLDEERQRFRQRLVKFTEQHAQHKDTHFHPVGWEDTVGGVGRPQELINQDLKECDYAVFVLHDRWGSPTGEGFSSGVEEEWRLAEELYEANKIRNIALFFKQVDPRQLDDPGKQLTAVLAFQQRIVAGKQYLFTQYATLDQFDDILEGYLARWFNDQNRTATGLDAGGPMVTAKAAVKPVESPGFDYWIGEAQRLYDAVPPELAGALFCTTKATEAANSDIEWARATNLVGIIEYDYAKLDECMAAFTAIADRFSLSTEFERRAWHAMALVNKAIMLDKLGRNEEAIAAYDDVLARFGTASEPPLRKQVAYALVNKATTLGTLSRDEEAISVYDDVLARFGTASEPPLREQVAVALVGTGFALARLGRGEEAISVYDDVLTRFGTASEPSLREFVAEAQRQKDRLRNQ
jgi:tetratricopeptide (TPR) repeat protein